MIYFKQYYLKFKHQALNIQDKLSKSFFSLHFTALLLRLSHFLHFRVQCAVYF